MVMDPKRVVADDEMVRDEQYGHLKELQEKAKGLDVVIEEGNIADDFQETHKFAPILARTLVALREGYNADAHKAARDSRAEIANYLGREEAVADIQALVKQFTTRADAAVEEKLVVDAQIKELQEILGSPERDALDVGGAMG